MLKRLYFVGLHQPTLPIVPQWPPPCSTRCRHCCRTWIGPPSPDDRDTLREIGLLLAELVESVNVRFSLRAMRLEDVKPWILTVGNGKAVEINSIMQLHRLLEAEENKEEPIDSVLSWIREIKPTTVTVVHCVRWFLTSGF
ncbi:hypothetical protein MLD38_038669 [Melastoma candidum]|uniref:Uncharacterized protein n=1 Tax=Melastoma candidum TaxID=119954 RepID=A0ACB9L0B2_9MYRT|nr:hypothetical protein MLD38_038669 [Melastoma candidum]